MSGREFKRALVLIAALGSVTSCGWEENGLSRLDQLHPPPPPPMAGSSSGSTCALPDQAGGATTEPSSSCLGLLSGQWALRLVEFGNISPLGPPAWDVTITDLFLVQLSSDRSSLQLTLCGEENSLTDDTGAPETLGQNSVPPALTAALAANPLTVPLPGDGTLQAAGVVWLWGVRGLTNPATDPLPTQADAGTVWDEDMDGNPGVTVDVSAPMGSIYLVKRAIFDFALGNSEPGWVTGALQFTLQQNALGATEALLETPAPITPRSDCTSAYQMRCVDSTYTCAQLVQDYQTLFLNAPAY